MSKGMLHRVGLPVWLPVGVHGVPVVPLGLPWGVGVSGEKMCASVSGIFTEDFFGLCGVTKNYFYLII
jgi:hypothetical protein